MSLPLFTIHSMTLVTIRNASKSYGGVPALKSASLELRAGEVHGLMGENGAGKSTLIKILAGVVAPDAIELTLRGQPIQVHSAADAFAHGFRFIHQELNVVPQLSVAENIFLGRAYPKRLGGLVNWTKLNRTATTTLYRLGIDHINPRQKIARLSPGDQMLVKIASTLLGEDQEGSGNQVFQNQGYSTEDSAQKPGFFADGSPVDDATDACLYVMDEPTASLTGEESARLFAVIQELTDQGCCVLYVSHRMDEVLRICNRVTVMRDGAVIATKELQVDADANSFEDIESTKRQIIRLMTGREMQQTYPPPHPPSSEHSASADNEPVLLDVRRLSTHTVAPLSFQVKRGEILGVAGLAGAGQSELLAALMGAGQQMERDVWLDGQHQERLDPAAAWNNQQAYVPRERRSQGLMLLRSIRDNVTLPHLGRMSYGRTFLNRRQEQRQTQMLAEQVQLKAIGIHQRSYQLSGGNQQKVVFARALAHQPKLLLLDEPTRGVDVGAKYDIYQLIRKLSEEGTAIIMSSTDLSELLGMCDRILVMVEGHASVIVDAEGLTQEALLTHCYG